jgi:DNA-binding transcriptional LysR family regulator
MARLLSFRHVETIHAVMLTGSVTGGAARLHVTQPAVSNILKEAEKRLGFAIFERFGGRVVPTRRAEVIFAKIEQSFSGLEEINQLCSRLTTEARDKVLIASTSAFGSAVLPYAIKSYRRDVNDAQFAVVSRASEHVQALVASQKADIGFALEEPVIPGVSSELLVKAPMMCLLPGDHPLTNKVTICAMDLRGEPIVSLSPGEHTDLDEIIRSAFADVAEKPSIVAECPAAITACAMVEAGNGVMIIDAISSHIFRHSSIVVRPFIPLLYLNLWAFRIPSRQTGFKQEQFISLARDVAANIIRAGEEGHAKKPALP